MAEIIAVREILLYLCTVNNKRQAVMKTIINMKAVKILRKAAQCFVAGFVVISKNTNHPIYCSRFYNPYVM